MAAPEYDFFATGPRPAPGAPVAGGDRFGTTVVPGAPSPLAAPPAAPGVSRFGLPPDAAGAPAGPLAGSGSPAGTLDWAPASTGRHGRPAAASVADDRRPGTVVAAGVLALVAGAVLVLGSGLLLLSWLAGRSQLASLGPDAAGFGDLASAMLTGLLVLGLVLGAFATLYLVLGVSTLRGRRWAAWVLLVVSSLSLLLSVYQVVLGGSGGAEGGSSYALGQYLGLAFTAAIVVLLGVGSGGRWLRRA